MQTTQELELKLELRAGKEIEAVRAALGTPLRVSQQENLYFDTAQGDLERLRWSVRCRWQDGEVELTVKGPRRQQGVLTSGGEWTTRLSPERWSGLKSGQEAATEIVRELVVREAIAAPAELDQPLLPLGTMRTTRSVYRLAGDGPALEVELDHTLYPGGVECFEAELELPEGADERASVARLAAVWQRAGVVWRVSGVPKIARFRAALAAQQAGSHGP